MKKVFSIIKTVINVFIVVMVLSFVLVVCMQRFSNNELSFLNFRMFTVVSGSMVPKYNIGDVLLAKETAPEKIKRGDAVSYLGNTGQFKDKVVTHEVIEIEIDENGKYWFYTKGVANLASDPIVGEEQIYGVIVGKLSLLTYVYKLVAKPAGMLIFVIIPLFYVIGSEFLGFLLDKEEERRAKLNEGKDKEKVTEKEKVVEKTTKKKTSTKTKKTKREE